MNNTHIHYMHDIHISYFSKLLSWMNRPACLHTSVFGVLFLKLLNGWPALNQPGCRSITETIAPAVYLVSWPYSYSVLCVYLFTDFYGLYGSWMVSWCVWMVHLRAYRLCLECIYCQHFLNPIKTISFSHNANKVMSCFYWCNSELTMMHSLKEPLQQLYVNWICNAEIIIQESL